MRVNDFGTTLSIGCEYLTTFQQCLIQLSGNDTLEFNLICCHNVTSNVSETHSF